MSVMVLQGSCQRVYSQEEIAHILCNPTLNKKLICSSHPVLVENNVSFVIDLSPLKNPNDV